jgi:hypothetical protein
MGQDYKTKGWHTTVHSSENLMGDVDCHDWLVEKHVIDVKGKKWYWILFLCMMDMTVLNEWIICIFVQGKTHWTFTSSVVL